MAKGYSRLYYQKQHKKDVFWQIWLPVGIGAAAFLTLGILAGFSLQTGTESAARWGHIAVMWMLMPVFVAGLALLLLLIGLVFGVIKITQIIPGYSAILLQFVERITRAIRNASNKAVKPLVAFRSYKAAIHRLIITVQYMLLGGNNDKLS